MSLSLNKLMTSDFNDGHVPDELRSYLLDFRNQYRILNNVKEQLVRQLDEKDAIIEDLTEENLKIMKSYGILMKNLNAYRKKINMERKIIRY